MDTTDFNKNVQQTTARVYQHATSFPPYEGSISNHGEKFADRQGTIDRVSPANVSRTNMGELTRSLTERRTKSSRNDAAFRRSFTGRVEDYGTENNKWANLNMETSL
ncbi:hypothetical protein K0M31_011164 [Melipona bicolor]|uniref:Uncharacterized protein n=1 Tax=Melipona bicolor TaxID=60889 RepID=A0AA40G907_9HYME|nr:hypothetical protein K0M31_011164 [Melipona bicolor]